MAANLSPGASGVGSVGKLSTGALTLSTSSNFNVDLAGAGGAANAGTTYDQANVTGTVTITGSNLVISSSLTAANIGQKYFIVANDLVDPVTGVFATGTTTASNNSDTFLINYLDDTAGGTSGNDISLTLIAVPEPSTWIAAAFALLSLGYAQRKRLAGMLTSKTSAAAK